MLISDARVRDVSDEHKSQTGYVFVLNGGAVDMEEPSKVPLQCWLQNINTCASELPWKLFGLGNLFRDLYRERSSRNIKDGDTA
ncbi:hypothetical protein Tco_0344908 [Tanacetum coccineum]